MRSVFIGAVVLTEIMVAPPAAASPTSEQLVDQCRPQLQTFIQEELVHNPDGSPISPEVAAERASIRANGVNDPIIRKLVDAIRTEYLTASKATMRKALGDMKGQMRGVANVRGQGPDNAIGFVATCMMEAMLADLEGRAPATSQSASAATVAARNKAAAEAAAIPPLRPTKALEAHNPANEASQCLEPIANGDFKRRGVSSTSGAVFRNSCAYPVETQWCIGDEACSRGFGNLATMPAKGDRGFSFDTKADTITTVRWAACRLGFGYRPDFKGTRHYVCK